MNITITKASPVDALEIVRQLTAANAGLVVQSVRKEQNRRTYRIIITGKPDDTGVLDDIISNSDVLAALRMCAAE